jgi:hypothetical protein
METCRRIGGSEAAGELAASCWLLGELAAGCWLLESWLLVGCWLWRMERAGGEADRRLGELAASWLAAGCWLVLAVESWLLARRMEMLVGCAGAGLAVAAGRMLAVRMETCRRKGGSEAAGELAAGCWLLVGCWLCGWKRAGG